MVTIYNGKAEETLDHVRYQRFAEKVAGQTYIPSSAPNLTTNVSCSKNFTASVCITKYNSGKGAGNELVPEEWGWRESEGSLVPVATNLLPAPEDLLTVHQYI